MKMSPGVLIIGALLVFWASAFIIAGLPAMTMTDVPSEIWRPLTDEEKAGHRLYVQKRLQLLPFALHPHQRLGHRRRADSPKRRLCGTGTGNTRIGTNRTGPLTAGW